MDCAKWALMESPREKIIALMLEQDLLLSMIQESLDVRPNPAVAPGMPAVELLPRLVTASKTITFLKYDTLYYAGRSSCNVSASHVDAKTTNTKAFSPLGGSICA